MVVSSEATHGGADLNMNSSRHWIGIGIPALVACALFSPSPVFAGTPLERAEDAYERQDFAAAFRAAKKALREGTEDPTANFIAGAACTNLAGTSAGQDISSCEGYLERALELAPEVPGIRYLLGFTAYNQAERFRRKGATEKARALYLRAAERFRDELELSPGYLKAIEGRAAAYSKAGEFDKAVAAHGEWIAAIPHEASPRASLGKLYAREGRIDDAIGVLAQFSPPDEDPFLDAAFEIGSELFGLEENEEASRVLKLVQEKNGSCWQLYGLQAQAEIAADAPRSADALERFLDSDAPEDARNAVESLFWEHWRLPDAEDVFPTAQKDLPSTIPDGVENPELVEGTYVSPVYPELARKAKIDGHVVMAVILTEEGVPLVVHATSSRPGLGFEEAAIEAVSQWRYRPAMQDGKPVKVFLTIVTAFTLQ